MTQITSEFCVEIEFLPLLLFLFFHFFEIVLLAIIDLCFDDILEMQIAQEHERETFKFSTSQLKLNLQQFYLIENRSYTEFRNNKKDQNPSPLRTFQL